MERTLQETKKTFFSLSLQQDEAKIEIKKYLKSGFL
jgi:hypothetical protein